MMMIAATQTTPTAPPTAPPTTATFPFFPDAYEVELDVDDDSEEDSEEPVVVVAVTPPLVSCTVSIPYVSLLV